MLARIPDVHSISRKVRLVVLEGISRKDDDRLHPRIVEVDRICRVFEDRVINVDRASCHSNVSNENVVFKQYWPRGFRNVDRRVLFEFAQQSTILFV